jgi:hypothetical protein
MRQLTQNFLQDQEIVINLDCSIHRYPKSKIDCLRFVVGPLLAPVFQGFFFAEAINSTNEANKVGSTWH